MNNIFAPLYSALLLLLALAAHAQDEQELTFLDRTNIGVKLGVNLPSMAYSNKEIDDYKSATYANFLVELFGEYTIISPLSIRPGFKYTTRGQHIDDSEFSYEFNAKYFEFSLPVALTLKTAAISPYILVGPVAGSVQRSSSSGSVVVLSSSSANVGGSSSSAVGSSSSVVQSSSSSAVLSGCGAYVGGSCDIGETVVIGTQTWAAKNLNCNVAGSVCYDNDPANCNIYGRLYDWCTAMRVCPSGWHLPSGEEWQVLVDLAGGDDVAGRYLKATDGWNSGGNGEGAFGFSALPGGTGHSNGAFYDVGYRGSWW